MLSNNAISWRVSAIEKNILIGSLKIGFKNLAYNSLPLKKNATLKQPLYYPFVLFRSAAAGLLPRQSFLHIWDGWYALSYPKS